ncbi:MAG: C-processing peptidase [Candidatus Beckwithbacteria bacterium GW2011_GWA2_43_10]|uniref:C-processing peptidase n=1 Tax=Candidatus Beckwithbacteria bacterium GW2011_GWA2_43_10 TaxID=1618369 RepID=A0A0G1EAF1_9BACT|nr:MAG: C-processing peptidase [Candidatus Beckwithbacteria bacterium GW2011_GWA2_43_10]
MRVKFFIIIIFFLAVGFIFWLWQRPTRYQVFLQETYQIIQANYWDKISDADLTKLYLAAAEKVTGKKVSAFKQLKSIVTTEADAATITDMVLANLQPFGKSRLYTQKLVVDLANTVANVNPEVNHYQELDLTKDATEAEIQSAYQTKTATATAEAKQKLDLAYQALKDTTTREIYDTTGADPTLPYRKITDQIYYIAINKFSPTTIRELTAAADASDAYPDLNTLILDLRDNIGGAIDGLPYFLGPFIGPDQSAYQFLQQGKKEDFTTKTGWLPGLVKFKKVVVLINQNTQSSAEVMASVLKKYHVGVLVGTTTRGWGTVEKVFSLEHQLGGRQTYSVFLVHHLTLREDGQPIESQGVEPDVSIKDPNWRQQLLAYFSDPGLITAIDNLLP